MKPDALKRTGLSFVGGIFGSLLTFAFFMGNYYVPFWYFPPIKADAPRVSYQVETLSPEFETLWSSEADPSYYYDRNSGSIHLTDAGNSFYFLGGFNQAKYGRMSLINLDPLTGEAKWRLFEPPAIGKGPASTIAANDRFIYVGFEGGNELFGDVSWPMTEVVAYDLNSREIVWSREVGTGTIDTLIASDSAVTVETFLPNHSYMLNPETGETLVAPEKEDEKFIWLIRNDLMYERGKDTSFQAVSLDSGEILWQSDTTFDVWEPLVLEGDVIIGRGGQARFMGTVFGVDAASGQTLWEYPDIIGNVAVDKGIAYFLTRNIQLWAVDVETGERLGTVSFSPVFQPDSPNHPYHVAASDGVVVLYLGEGQQLFGFRFLPS
jgi:outer membrane protein assembly factor BamB